MDEDKNKPEQKGKSLLRHLPLMITITVTFIGYMVSHWSGLDVQKHNAELARVNSQLELYYGPLYSFSVLSERTWEDFKRNHPEITRKVPEGLTPEKFYSDDLKKAWKDYMLVVQRPYFERVEKALLDHSDLVDADGYTAAGDYEYPPPLVDMLSHIYEYNVLFAKWRRGENEKIWGPNYPSTFDKYVRAKYAELRRRQIDLLEK